MVLLIAVLHHGIFLVATVFHYVERIGGLSEQRVICLRFSDRSIDSVPHIIVAYFVIGSAGIHCFLR